MRQYQHGPSLNTTPIQQILCPINPSSVPSPLTLAPKIPGFTLPITRKALRLRNIEKEGKVYQLEKDKYTLLMAKRTAARHQRRGYDRRQMVKRLFKLIWEKHFKLEWDKDVQQTISFLLNRRGFTFLTEEYDAEILSRFPKEAFELLPEELKIDANVNENDEYDFASALTEWVNEGVEKVRKCFDEILLKAYYEKTRKNCQEKKTKDATTEGKDSVKLVNTPKSIFEKLFSGLPSLKNRIETETYTFNNDQGEEITARYYNKGGTFNILSFINNNPARIAGEIREKLPSEQKEWLFNPTGNFDLEKNREKLSDSTNNDAKAHFQHLAFALYKTLNELESGGRHRSRYFKEINSVLNSAPSHGYLKNFCGKLQSGGYPGLDKEKLARLLGHLSNLELKPLRKYFDDKLHKKSDYWNEARLSEIFNQWILREWRVDPVKDKDKATGKRGDYKKLREDWYNHKEEKPNTVIEFWLKTDPFLTIPPYQDNNNRRPPKCQSLILNPTFLGNKYLKWKTWLGELREPETVKEYLKSGKKNSYFPDKKAKEPLNARVLQFIFDRAKDSDPLNLNEIYSHAKKWRQKQSTDQERQTAKSKLEKAIGCSHLSDGLKTERDYDGIGKELFKEGTFLHLVCKYYKQRQRARDGRLFIHPEYRYVKNRGYENTGRFDDKNCLLTYCNHKPRQKKYQSFQDIAHVFQISPQELKSIIGGTDDSKVIKWLKDFRVGRSSLEGTCQQAAKIQKEQRGFLKENLRKAVFRCEIEHIRQKKKKSLTCEELHKLKKYSETRSPDAGDKKLFNLDKNIKNLSHELAKSLFNQHIERDDPRVQKFCSIFAFTQIHKIAFMQRSGNSNTCAVCSTDNAHRMQMISSRDKKESHAKAQRLPAIPTRLIDGAVMRMARIAGGAIAIDKWKKIEKELEAGRKCSRSHHHRIESL